MLISHYTYLPTRHCGLCRLRFPSQRTSYTPSWQVDALAVIDLGGDRFHISRLAVSLSTNKNIAIEVAGRVRRVTFKSDRSDQEPGDQIAYRLHSWCHSALIWKLPGCSIASLYRLATILVPNSSTWDALYSDHGLIDSSRALPWMAITDQYQLFETVEMLKLPVEMRLSIWKYVGAETPCGSFILVTGESARLVEHMQKSSPFIRASQILNPLHVPEMITIFGSEFIRGFVPEIEGSTKEVASRGITQVQFAMRIGGICAFKLLGKDLETDWYGKLPERDGWFGSLPIKDNLIRVFHNGLNYTTFLESDQEQLLWDHPRPSLLANLESSMFKYDRSSAMTRCRLLRYLPLYTEQGFATAITVYFTKTGMSGIIAHFSNTSYISGSQDGCPLHFVLQKEERIAYVWLRVVDSTAFSAPALMVQTTLGRTHTFGPFILPIFVNYQYVYWTLLPHKKSITGFYYQNPTSDGIIMTLGVVDDGESTSTALESPQYYECPVPNPPIASPNVGLFISVAMLRDLKSAELCYDGNRCTGMVVHDNEGQTTVLGQWRTSSSRRRTYDNTEMRFTRIALLTAVLEPYYIIEDIFFLTDDDTPLDSTYVLSLEWPITWWFSEQYDVIETFTGRSCQVPGKCKRELCYYK